MEPALVNYIQSIAHRRFKETRGIAGTLRIKVTHLRHPEPGTGKAPWVVGNIPLLYTAYEWKEVGVKVATKGGLTRAVIQWIPEGSAPVDLAYGEAFCSPKDNFSRRIGRAKAVGRAIGALNRTDIRTALQ
jgi:hypothetical protein